MKFYNTDILFQIFSTQTEVSTNRPLNDEIRQHMLNIVNINVHIIYAKLQTVRTSANDDDPDQTLQNAESDQGYTMRTTSSNMDPQYLQQQKDLIKTELWESPQLCEARH